jgi:uncharacterized Fe-S center protein
METAARNGYNSATLGCPFICADGFMGIDDYRVDLPEGYLLKEAYIAQAIAAADVLITLTHFKGHGMGVIGGSIKNLGIGAQSKRGKFNVHLGGHPKYSLGASAIFHPENFKGRKGENDWQQLEECCPFDLIHVTEDSIEWEREKCHGCPSCPIMLSHGLLEVTRERYEATNAAIADACLATEKAVGRDKVAYINMAIDISRSCDCVGYADTPILPHLGVFASSDPVAIDKACVDKSIETEGIHGSTSEEMDVLDSGKRKFDACSPMLAGVGEEIQINTGEIIGLGSRQYELVSVPEKAMIDFVFPPDQRMVGTRFRRLTTKLQPFPYDRYEGKGFLREDEVDLERVNTYYENQVAP